MTKTESMTDAVEVDAPDENPRIRRASDPLAAALAIAAAALDKKAIDPVMLHVGPLVSYTDYVLIVTANAPPHAEAIVDACSIAARGCGLVVLSTEGRETARWILADYGEVIVHVFLETDRAYYDLEGLWIDAADVEIPGAEEARTHPTGRPVRDE